MQEDDSLKLSNQLCFPLYAAARKIVAAYAPFLKEIHLTYTQYVTMMVLWEKREISVKDLGATLYLDSGTLTPLLKKLEKEGLIVRRRSHEDERIVIVDLSEKGEALKEKATKIPCQMAGLLTEKGAFLSAEEVEKLKSVLYEIIERLH